MAGVLLLVLVLMWGDREAVAQDKWKELFDGESFAGFEGPLDIFRIEDGAIVGGSMAWGLEENRFLCSEESYDDFILRLEFKLRGDETNAGIQFRSERVPHSHEVMGYQADLGEGYFGALYDESRRHRILASPQEGALAGVLDPDGWNEYVILAEGRRIRLYMNDVQTVDYTEPEKAIPQDGRICFQIHSGPPGEAWYRNVQLKPLGPRGE